MSEEVHICTWFFAVVLLVSLLLVVAWYDEESLGDDED